MAMTNTFLLNVKRPFSDFLFAIYLLCGAIPDFVLGPGGVAQGWKEIRGRTALGLYGSRNLARICLSREFPTLARILFE